MSEKKAVVVCATVHAISRYSFHFVFDGDINDDAAMKEAAWEALNFEATLAPPECIDHEYVDEESDGTEIEIDVESGSPDDFRAKPKQRTKKQLWRRVARLAGELTFFHPDEELVCEGDSPFDCVRRLIDASQHFEGPREERIANKLKAAFKEWEAAT